MSGGPRLADFPFSVEKPVARYDGEGTASYRRESASLSAGGPTNVVAMDMVMTTAYRIRR